MIFRRVLLLLAAAATLAVSAGVCVVALAFALYALVKPYVGQAGAAGVVALAAAILIGLVGAVLASQGRARKAKTPEPRSFIDRIAQFVRDKPATAIAAAAAAGLMAVRNPEYLGSALRAFIEGRNPPKR